MRTSPLFGELQRYRQVLELFVEQHELSRLHTPRLRIFAQYLASVRKSEEALSGLPLSSEAFQHLWRLFSQMTTFVASYAVPA